MYSLTEIASAIDHTLLNADATHAQIVMLCAEAGRFGFAAVCVNPYWVPLALRELGDSSVALATVCGFPLGATSTAAKVAETGEAADNGAREIDMVINIGALLSGEEHVVRRDVEAVVEEAHRGAAIVKVILETGLLDDDQKRLACRIAKDAGAEFVKTSTGFGPGGATVEDIELMRDAAGPRIRVKASGGIRTRHAAERMLDAGATRIGTSSGIAIIEAAAV